MRPGESLESLSRDQLLELLSIYSKNWLAMDGVWFQSVERKFGMDEATMWRPGSGSPSPRPGASSGF